MSASSSTSAPRDYRCEVCGGEKAIFIDGGRNLCRHCVVIPDDHRPALNALMAAGLIYGNR